MCGVAGILSKSENLDPINIYKMAISLSHRGPDGYQFYKENRFHNSHNLLSLHSKLTKPGPYTSQNNRWVLSFNGEIYNYLELKKEIDSQILIEWQHDSDAEVLLEGWSLEGQSFLKKINGMFAFSIWDKLTKTLYLACDHLSEKNLYYTKWKDQFLFSSEIKSFTTLDYPHSLNHNKLDEYLSYRYISGSETLFKNIFKLQQGELLEISSDLKIQSRFYDQFTLNTGQDERPIDSRDTELKELLRSCVEIRTSSSLKNSIFLSSGLDSTLIAKLLPEKSYAFTLNSDTTADLFEISKICKQKQFFNVHVPSPMDIDSLLNECILAIEEPIGDSIQISNMLLAKAAKEQNIRIGFSGDGADEVFAGYIHHLAYSILHEIKKNCDTHLLKGFSRCLKYVPGQLISYLAPYSQNLGSETKTRLITIIDKLLKNQNYISEMTQVFKIPNINSPIHQSEMNINTLSELLKHDQTHWLPNYVLLRNDKILMSQGVEGRYPYLDRRLLKFASRLPSNKLIDRFERKSILKKASLSYLSHKTAYQKKKSFVIDYNLNALISNTNFKNSFLTDFIKTNQINFEKNEFIDRKKLFSLIVLQRWLNIFKLN